MKTNSSQAAGPTMTKNLLRAFAVLLVAGASALHAQTIGLTTNLFKAVGVSASEQSIGEKKAIRVVKSPEIKEFDEATFAKVQGVSFHNGTIEVKVRSRLLKEAPDFARGFIGVAFRINEDSTKFESIYLRPANARVDNQLRRNGSIQYFSFPDFKFDRLRKETPGVYESYADMGLDEWIKIRIEVKGAQAKLFINGHKQPALVVNDLKHGSDSVGGVGLWVDVGTEGYFSDLRIAND